MHLVVLHQLSQMSVKPHAALLPWSQGRRTAQFSSKTARSLLSRITVPATSGIYSASVAAQHGIICYLRATGFRITFTSSTGKDHSDNEPRSVFLLRPLTVTLTPGSDYFVTAFGPRIQLRLFATPMVLSSHPTSFGTGLRYHSVSQRLTNYSLSNWHRTFPVCC